MSKIKRIRPRLRTRLWRLFHPKEWAEMQKRWESFHLDEMSYYKLDFCPYCGRSYNKEDTPCK